jgi:hypothetical protein
LSNRIKMSRKRKIAITIPIATHMV